MSWEITVETANALDFRTHMAQAKDDKQSGIPGLDFDTRAQMDRLTEAAIALVSAGQVGGGPLKVTISGTPGQSASVVAEAVALPEAAPAPVAAGPESAGTLAGLEPPVGATVSAGPTPPQD